MKVIDSSVKCKRRVYLAVEKRKYSGFVELTKDEYKKHNPGSMIGEQIIKFVCVGQKLGLNFNVLLLGFNFHGHTTRHQAMKESKRVAQLLGEKEID